MSEGIEYENGLPITIESWASMDAKRRFQLVRTDTMMPIKGDIVTAVVETGECCVSIPIPGEPEPKTETLSFGPRGFRIVVRRK